MAKGDNKVDQVLDIIKEMTILELRDLNTKIQDEFGITAAVGAIAEMGTLILSDSTTSRRLGDTAAFRRAMTCIREHPRHVLAHAQQAVARPIDEEAKREIRALLGPLTASLHASRNWRVAVTDELSGLASRRYFEARLAEEWARRDRYETPLTVAIFDLDRFKTVNDSLGHAAGDLVIRRFGAIMKDVVRASDLPCRFGGEEFAALFTNTSAAAARTVADRIRKGLEKSPPNGRNRYLELVSANSRSTMVCSAATCLSRSLSK